MTGRLDGLTILVPESRELDLFAGMIEAQGAKAVRCPLVAILDVEDAAPVKAWLDRLIANTFDDLVLLTGEGLRRLLTHAERDGRQKEAIVAISRLRTIVRGPKPTRVLREIGLTPAITALIPTSQGVIDSLRNVALARRKIGLQLYPGSPAELTEFLTAKGAEVFPVTPYRYASETDAARVASVIREIAAGEIDVVAFTSSPQIDRLFDVAREGGIENELRQALSRSLVAAIGPIVAAHLEELGVTVSVQPKSFHLKPLITAIAESAAKRAAAER